MRGGSASLEQTAGARKGWRNWVQREPESVAPIDLRGDARDARDKEVFTFGSGETNAAVVSGDSGNVGAADGDGDFGFRVTSWGVFQLHIISLVPMGEGGGHILKDFKGEEEKRKRKTAGGEQITTFYSKEKGCN